jgi:integrase
MARPATGTIMERPNASGGVNRTLRFYARGKRRTVPLGPVSHTEAERRLGQEMADVERDTWEPPALVDATTEVEVPTFHAFSETWWTLKEGEWTDNTRSDYRWRLERHLLPFFGETPIDQITAGSVKRYMAAKLAEADAIREAAAKGEPMTREAEDRRGRRYQQPLRPMSPRSINMTVTLLGAIIESAIDDDDFGKLIQRNPARGRRVKERAPRRSYLETAGQIVALLDAAGELDRSAAVDRQHVARRAMVATLTFAGLRISELCALRWRNVDLAAGWLTVGDAKTDAGRRRVKIRGALRDELLTIRHSSDQSGYVFPTRTGKRMSADNFRSRVLTAAIKRANDNLATDDLPPLPDGLTPHSLRRTFCSVLYALGEDPGTVMDEMGHTDPALALRVYRQAMRRGEDEKAQLRALVEGGSAADYADADAANGHTTAGFRHIKAQRGV